MGSDEVTLRPERRSVITSKGTFVVDVVELQEFAGQEKNSCKCKVFKELQMLKLSENLRVVVKRNCR